MIHKSKKTFFHTSSKLFFITAFAVVLGLPSTANLTQTKIAYAAETEITEVWWPTTGAVVKGSQPLKAILQGKSLSEYKMYWRVDGGQLNAMYDSSTDYPHKEASVDVSSWNWKGVGPYKITFVSHNLSGNEISQKSIDIYTGEKTTTVVANSSSPTPIAPIVVSMPVATTAPTPVTTTPTPVVEESIEVWWPTENASLSGTQPLKAIVKNRTVENYSMAWQVDGGKFNSMSSNYSGGAHKETKVDLTSWTWKGNGPYKITFVAKDKSNVVIAKKDVSVFNSAIPKASTTITSPTPTINPVPTAPVSSGLYVDPNNPAKRQANEWRTSRPADAALMDKIANQGAAVWIGNWNSNVESDVRTVVTNAANQNATPVFVAYNITDRDCGNYSAGGAGSADAYKTWIRAVARGIADKKAIVILEPDAVAGWDCLSQTNKDIRAGLLADAVNVLKANTNTKVYIDGGNPTWVSSYEMATRLNKVNISRADGFSLNVSNFYTTSANTTYGQSLSSKLNGKHFIIDTSRNGNGSNGQWCNPDGRAIGNKPTLVTGDSLIDGYLWLKIPGESDGNCNGGPSAGQWWGDYAIGLASRANW